MGRRWDWCASVDGIVRNRRPALRGALVGRTDARNGKEMWGIQKKWGKDDGRRRKKKIGNEKVRK